MPQLEQLQFLLKKHGLWAKKSLGQNFLVDEKALDTIVDAAELTSADHVVEVGPGTGFLTERLVERAERVMAIELDSDMIRVLRSRFGKMENLEILNEDALKFQINRYVAAKNLAHPPSSGIPPLQSPLPQPPLAPSGRDEAQGSGYKVVANIPYYITSPLIKHFLHSSHPPELMVLLVQKEVAEKICGKGGKTLLTIQVEVFGQPELVAQVPASSFYPAPKVDSAVLRIRPYAEPLVPADRQKAFFRLVQFGYSQKRKKLSNTLAAGLRLKPSEVAEKMKAVGIDPDLRAEHLGVGEWMKLMEAF